VGSSPTRAIMKDNLLTRLQTAIEETSTPRAKTHEYTSECLSCLLEDCYKALKEKESTISLLEEKVFDAYKELDKINMSRWLFDEQSG
jgi:lipopolysaccharide biosynthesis regulator YciM